jgi:hypothetical protein
MNKPILYFLLCLQAVNSYASQPWYDTFFQYRIPVEIICSKPGWNVITITEKDITHAINGIDQFEFNPQFFAYDNILVVDDKTGKLFEDAGFYCYSYSDELVNEQSNYISIPTQKDAYYLVKYRASSNKSSPLSRYNQVFPINSTIRTNNYLSSYEPSYLPMTEKTHQRLLLSDGSPLIIKQDKYTVKALDISVKKVKIKLLMFFDEPGKKRLTLYYQPLCSHYLKIPTRKISELSQATCSINTIAKAEKYTENTLYTLMDNKEFTLSFAETTEKITPDTKAPELKKTKINISCAKNESQSFQVVIKPHKEILLKTVKVLDLPVSETEIFRLDYVPINKPSFLTPATIEGLVGDPLVELNEQTILPQNGNMILFFTIRISKHTSPGIYDGKIIMELDKKGITVPLTLEIYDFELPKYSPFQASMGGQYFATPGFGKKSILDYHRMSTHDELKKISNAYFDIMVKNKFYPKSVLMYTEIPFKWQRPPAGYNIDEPNNFFKLTDFDFTELNAQLSYHIDELKLNSVSLVMTNPRLSNLFKHLPGRRLAKGYTKPFHITMGNQFFYEEKLFAWGKRQGDAYFDKTTEITVKQFDRLLLDYYGALANNLQKYGWLDKCYINFDLTPDMERMKHFIKLLRSNSLTSQIKIVALFQNMDYLNYQHDNDGFEFKNKIIFLPNIDENYNFWESHLFTDYGIGNGLDQIWGRAVTSSRLTIDSPGINNRIIGLELFNKKGSGYFVCETIDWDNSNHSPANPWFDPYTRFGNGVLSYFYPPCPTGISPQPVDAVIPSVRIMTFREGVDDYEYAYILRTLIAKAKNKSIDTKTAESVLNEIDRFFYNSVSWSQNDAWYLKQRDKMAKNIVKLKHRLEK